MNDQNRDRSSPWPWIWWTLGILGFLTVVCLLTLDTKGVDMGTATLKTLSDLGMMFTQPNLSKISWWEGLQQILVTLSLGFLTTIIGAILAFFLAIPASKNLGNPLAGVIIRQVVAVIRAVPTVLWVLIFAISAGLGAAAAIIGMTFHTVGYLIKAYSESFEELDGGVIEALKAGGAKFWPIIFQAVVPSSLTFLISWTFIRFEINFTVAVAMGAAAGAGGIGFDFFMASSMYFDLREVGAITYLILGVALILEIVANRLKTQIRKKS